MSNEPTYADPDDPFGDNPKKGLYKWQTPKPGSTQAAILKAANRKHYRTRKEQADVNEIAKSMVSLSLGQEVKYPTEWVDHCLMRCKELHAQGIRIGLERLLSMINNEDKRLAFVNKWSHDHHAAVMPYNEETDEGDGLAVRKRRYQGK